VKTFTLPSRPNNLAIVNHERIDDRIILKQVLTRLNENKDIHVGKKVLCPSEDIYECKFKDKDFTLIFSLDDGVEIYCEDIDILEKIKKYIEM
jgi:hypothetical protein